jgi:hypothetical protein
MKPCSPCVCRTVSGATPQAIRGLCAKCAIAPTLKPARAKVYSPPIRRRDRGESAISPDRDERNGTRRPCGPVVPGGTCSPLGPAPSVETLGYSLSPCRADAAATALFGARGTHGFHPRLFTWQPSGLHLGLAGDVLPRLAPVFRFSGFGLRISFGFRPSDFGFFLSAFPSC